MTSALPVSVTTAELHRIIRAGAHAVSYDRLRPAQRFQHHVTSVDVARVFHGLESGVRLYCTPGGRWMAPPGTVSAIWAGRLTPHRLSVIVGEMLRTGLADRDREWLVPALVHLQDGRVSACRFEGENVGATRSRLLGLEWLPLVDCQACVDLAPGVAAVSSAIVSE